mmetsp:Transcript_9029/g.8907  ORF Transcript_9029/g.8907 Transcript_9029/m.8907 type:complete len:1143 (-) Transcript_9029:155-3583(-)|eukprot:CAMPEP_0119039642 /NCGR_PEP_ID=MMETSP1177-20130426/9248_1 /TAXON_ID=2985 /ORGANISM="Ochromonas sp, Strain CCMP1899" /LENGTH=1142 /DNA_ID=CAMNT_0007003797 /DNA_START=151 /DNA_END=3579 /DNA_ORIENTATION=+
MTDRISSGFSFLSSKGVDTDTIKIEQTDLNVDKSRKLEETSELSADNYESSMLGLPISMPQDIKIFKSSAAKFVKKKKRASNQFVRGGDVEDDVDEMTVSVVHDSPISISDGNSQTGSDLSDHLSPDEIVTTPQHQMTSAIVTPLPKNISIVSCEDTVKDNHEDSLRTVKDNHDDALHTVKGNHVLSDPTSNEEEGTSHQFLDGKGQSDEGDNSGDIRDDITTSTDSKEVPVDDVYSSITDPIATSHIQSISVELSSLEVTAASISVSTTISPVATPTSPSLLSIPTIPTDIVISIPTIPNSVILTTSKEQTNTSDSLSDAPLQPVIEVTTPATKKATQLLTESNKETIPVELNKITSSTSTLLTNETLLKDCQLKPASSSEISSGTDVTCSNYHENNDLEGKSDSEYIKKIQVISIDFAMQTAQLSARRVELTKEGREMRFELQSAETWLIDANAKAAAMEDDQLRLAALEEFDEADALTDALEGLQIEISNKTERCDHIGKESLLVVQVSMEANLKAQATIMRNVIIQATATMEQEQKKLAENSTEKSDIHLQEEERLKREKERIDLENLYTCDEEIALTEQTMDLESIISAQIGEDTLEKRALLESQRGIVANEIIELERLLILKKAEEEGLGKELLCTNEKINLVRSKFQKSIQRVEDRRALMEGTRRSCSLDQEALDVSYRIFDEEICASNQSREASLKWCQRMALEVDYLSTVKNVLFSPEEHSPTLQVYDEDEGQRDSTPHNLQNLRDDQTNTGHAVCVAVKEQLDLSSQGQSLQATLRELQDMGIKLEVDKKVLAASRRFKEAAVVAKDEKANYQKREEIEAMLTEHGIQATKKFMEIKSLETIHDLAAKAFRFAKQHADMDRHRVLKDRLNRLKTVQKSVSTTLFRKECNEEEGDRLDDDGLDIDAPLAATALLLIQAEIQELTIEGACIEESHPSLGLNMLESDDELDEIIPLNNPEVYHSHDELEAVLNPSTSNILEYKYSDDGKKSDSKMSVVNITDKLDTSAIFDETFADSAQDESILIQETLERRNYLISLTRDNVQELESIDKELADATDVENYELADILDSRMNVIKKTIYQLLRDLDCSEDDFQCAELGGDALIKIISILDTSTSNILESKYSGDDVEDIGPEVK